MATLGNKKDYNLKQYLKLSDKLQEKAKVIVHAHVLFDKMIQ